MVRNLYLPLLLTFLLSSNLSFTQSLSSKLPSPGPSQVIDLAVSNNQIFVIGNTVKHGNGVYSTGTTTLTDQGEYWSYWPGIDAVDLAAGVNGQPAFLLRSGEVILIENGTQIKPISPLPGGATPRKLGDFWASISRHCLWILDTQGRYYSVDKYTFTPQQENKINSPDGLEQTSNYLYYNTRGTLYLLDVNSNSSATQVRSGVEYFDVAYNNSSIVAGNSQQIFFKSNAGGTWVSRNMNGVSALGATANGYYFVDQQKRLFYHDGRTDILLSGTGTGTNTSNQTPQNTTPNTDSLGVNAQNYEGNTSFWLASNQGDFVEMNRLIAEGADINIPNLQGETALFAAVRSKQSNVAKFLLDKGMYVDHQNKSGQTPLQIAFDQKDFRMIPVLLDKNADPNKTDALDKAVRNNDKDMLYYLLSIPTLKPEKGLAAAAAVNDAGLFNQLIGKGAKVTDQLPVEAAIQNNNSTILQSALSNGGDPAFALQKSIEQERDTLIGIALEYEVDPKPALDYALEKNNLNLFTTALNKKPDQADTALPLALEKGNMDMARAALNAGASPNPALPNLVQQGKIDEVAFLLENGASADTTLNLAVQQNQLAIATLAIEKNANPRNPEYLPTAIRHQNLELVQLLLNYGADPNTGMLEAVRIEDIPILKELLNRNADPNPGMETAIGFNNAEIVKLLIERGANGQKPELMQQAAREGNPEIVQLLLNAGGNPNEGMIPALEWKQSLVVQKLIDARASLIRPELLKIAVENNDTPSATALLQAKANATFVNRAGDNLLHTTCGFANTTIADLLIKAGVPVEQRNVNGYTPLIKAAEKSSSNLVSLLLDNGASVNSLTNDSRSALYFSALYKDINSARVLIDAGADVNQADNLKTNPLHLACRNNDINMAGLLLDKAANPNTANHMGNTPLHMAVPFKNNVSMAKLLIDNGADYNARNGENRTVFSLARGRKLKKYLKGLGAEK